MGEGWGDFMGTALRLKADDTRDTSYPTGCLLYTSDAADDSTEV